MQLCCYISILSPPSLFTSPHVPRYHAQGTIILLLKNQRTPEISNEEARHHPISFEGTHLTSFSKGPSRAFELDKKLEMLMPNLETVHEAPT